MLKKNIAETVKPAGRNMVIVSALVHIFFCLYNKFLRIKFHTMNYVCTETLYVCNALKET
jgi:hypothetical protein